MSAALGNFLFRHRNALFPVAFLLVFLPGPRLFAQQISATLLGFSVAALGQVVRTVTIGLEYIVRGGRDRQVYAQHLVIDGIYHHCRNPMYVGNVLILVGVAIASNSWSCVLAAIPLFVFFYVAIVAAEERYLLRKFGEQFETYARATPRWVPKLRGLLATLRNSQFHWRRVLSKEYGTPFGWICGICLLSLWNLWRDGYLARSDAPEGLLVVALLTTLAWAAVRILKKRRVLVAD